MAAADIVLSSADLGDVPPTWMVESLAPKTGWEPLWHADSERLEAATSKGATGATNDEDVYVYGRRYAVNLKTRMLRPLYWKEAPNERRVVRGTWFWKHTKSGRWHPYEEEDAGRIEAIHQAAPVVLKSSEESELPLLDGVHKVVIRRRPNLRPNGKEKDSVAAVEAASGDGVEGGVAAALASAFAVLPPLEWTVRQRGAGAGPFLKDVGSRPVRRGYGDYSYPEEEAADGAEQLPTDHLVLVVHGIGEAMWSRDNVRALSIREHAAGMRALSLTARADFDAALGSSGGSGGGSSVAGSGGGSGSVAGGSGGGAGSGSAGGGDGGGGGGGDATGSSGTAADEGKAAGPGRFEFLPVEWHESVHGEENELTKRLLAVTLPTVPAIREVANSVVLDVMIFMTGQFQTQILRDVGKQMNNIYATFLKANPGFENGGRVSLVGHSLGSIIVFDILQGQASGGLALRPGGGVGSGDKTAAANSDVTGSGSGGGDSGGGGGGGSAMDVEAVAADGSGISGGGSSSGTAEESRAVDDATRPCETCGHATQVPVPVLGFKPHAFFACGSPIGCFLALRGDVKPKGYRLPTTERFFNVFHPHDPVAYRLEPLLSPRAGALPPAMVPHKGGLRLHMKWRATQKQISQSVISAAGAWTDGLRRIGSVMQRTPRVAITDGSGGGAAAVVAAAVAGGGGNALSEAGVGSSGSGGSSGCVGVAKPASPEEAAAAAKEMAINGGERVDFVLQETNFTAANPYLGAITSHTSYLADEDFIWFVMRVGVLSSGEPLPQELTQLLPGFS